MNEVEVRRATVERIRAALDVTLTAERPCAGLGCDLAEHVAERNRWEGDQVARQAFRHILDAEAQTPLGLAAP